MTNQATKTTQTIGVKIYAMVNTSYKCTEPESVNDQICDIYFPTIQDCADRENLGADDYHYSIDGKDEMVFVNKELLEALVDQCQRLSDNDAIYNDKSGASFNYSDLNKLVLGMDFPMSVVGSEPIKQPSNPIGMLNNNSSLVI